MQELERCTTSYNPINASPATKSHSQGTLSPCHLEVECSRAAMHCSRSSSVALSFLQSCHTHQVLVPVPRRTVVETSTCTVTDNNNTCAEREKDKTEDELERVRRNKEKVWLSSSSSAVRSPPVHHSDFPQFPKISLFPYRSLAAHRFQSIMQSRSFLMVRNCNHSYHRIIVAQSINDIVCRTFLNIIHQVYQSSTFLKTRQLLNSIMYSKGR